MTKMEIILLVVSVAFIVIAGYAVSLLIQIRKTAKCAEETLGDINQRLPVIMKNLEEISANVNLVMNTAGKQVDNLAQTADKINSAMNFYLEKELIFREQISIPVANTFRTYGALIKGVRVFLDSLKTGAPSGSARPSR
jgi:hypothetical protein